MFYDNMTKILAMLPATIMPIGSNRIKPVIIKAENAEVKVRRRLAFFVNLTAQHDEQFDILDTQNNLGNDFVC